MDFEFSKHALEQMQIRGVSQSIVLEILQHPQQIIKETGYTVYQSMITFENKPYLIRAFINEATTPFKIITVYKTSKIQKYL